MSDVFVSRKELATATGLSETMVKRLTKQGKIPAYVLSPKVTKYRTCEVLEALKMQNSEPEKQKQKGKAKVVTIDDVELPPHLNTKDALAAVATWLDYKRTKGQPYRHMPALMALFKQFATPTELIAAINSSMASNYQGIFHAKKREDRSKSQVTFDKNLELIEKLKREDKPL